jgi:hypothetical protein
MGAMPTNCTRCDALLVNLHPLRAPTISRIVTTRERVGRTMEASVSDGRRESDAEYGFESRLRQNLPIPGWRPGGSRGSSPWRDRDRAAIAGTTQPPSRTKRPGATTDVRGVSDRTTPDQRGADDELEEGRNEGVSALFHVCSHVVNGRLACLSEVTPAFVILSVTPFPE